MGDTLAQKIMRTHLIDGVMAPGNQITLKIDQTLTQDLTGILVAQYVGAVAPEKLKTEKTVFYCDHNVIAAASEGADDHLFLKTTAERYGIDLSKTGNGICHFLHCQRYAAPGKTLLGSDSHTPTAGALGMLAIGSGGLTVAEASMGEGFKMNYPAIMNVRLTGKLRPGVASKDVALEMMRQLTVKGGRGYILEYTGDGVDTLSITERQTISNMSIETGAVTGIFPVDAHTRAFLKGQKRAEDYVDLRADPDAVYDKCIEINLSTLEPLVALPHMPDKVKTVAEAGPVVPNSVFIGSCTNGSYYDIAKAARILKGHKVHKEIDLTVGPGSRQVLAQLINEGVIKDLVDAGARIIECSCGPCIGIGQVPPQNGVAVRTSNRNFPGRSGNNDASVYLVSPETAAATAINGCLTDPRTLIVPGMMEQVTEPEECPVDDSGIIRPCDVKDPKAVTIIQ
ncbi:MAG: aconitase/3-isopropylmalate dehydratase large subunit family protein, partial [Pseudoflavonifractor sp.]